MLGLVGPVVAAHSAKRSTQSHVHSSAAQTQLIADDVRCCASPNVCDGDDQDDYHDDGGAHLFLLISSISLFLLCLCLCACLCLCLFVCVSDGDDQDDYHDGGVHLFFLRIGLKLIIIIRITMVMFTCFS